jgi:hypothetical protein
MLPSLQKRMPLPWRGHSASDRIDAVNTGPDWIGSELTTLHTGGEAHFWTGLLGGVCVDLGYARTGVKMVSRNPGVVVLTHSDADHINGAKPFFEAQPCGGSGGGGIRELWVPYEWSVLVDVFQKVLRGEVTVEGIRRTEEHAQPLLSSHGDPESRADPESNWPVSWPDVSTFTPESEDPDDAEFPEPERDDVNMVAAALAAGVADGTIDARATLTESDITKISGDIARKATRLRRIFAAALNAGWKIRWFSTDHKRTDSWLTSGEPGLVTISNAQEVHVLAARGSGALLLYTAQLTIQNRRALAPYLWGVSCGRDVIIWSDGDGGGAEHLKAFPWCYVGLMSAPHHGSHMSAHDPIWESLFASTYLPDIVRTGGFSSQTMRPILCSLPHHRSRATHTGPGHQLGDVVWRESTGFQ